MIIDSPVLFTLLAGTLVILDPYDWPLTGKRSNLAGNVTLNASESAVIPGILQVDNGGLFSINDANGISMLAVI